MCTRKDSIAADSFAKATASANELDCGGLSQSSEPIPIAIGTIQLNYECIVSHKYKEGGRDKLNQS